MVTARKQETGAVRIRPLTHNESREVPVLVHSSAVQIERVAVNRFVDAEFAPRNEGDTLIVPVFEYVPVTELRLRLKAEVRITTVATVKADVHVTEVQRQQVVVDKRLGTAGDWVADASMPSAGADASASKPA